LDPFCPKFGDAHTVIFPSCKELLKSKAGILDLGNEVPVFGMSQNPPPPCLLFTVLFDLFGIIKKHTGRADRSKEESP
jgi:hypothetical protein